MSNDEFSNPTSIQIEPNAQTGMALIQAMTMACQGMIDVKIPAGKVRPVSLNMMVVAEPGQRKTSINSVLLKAIAKDGA